jgi:hypothetical protein
MPFITPCFLLASFDVAKYPHIAQNTWYGFIVEFCAIRKVERMGGECVERVGYVEGGLWLF